MSQQIMDANESRQFKSDIPEFLEGDTVRVGVRLVDGSRERVQDFEGVVIRTRAGGIHASFTVRRISSPQRWFRAYLFAPRPPRSPPSRLCAVVKFVVHGCSTCVA